MAARAAAPSSPCPGQIRRWNGLQVPPQAGRCHSPLTTLWWLPMFLPVKRQIVQQTALLWIHPAVGFSKEVKENPWPEPLNFETELCSLKSCKVWAGSNGITAETLGFSTMSDSYSSWHRRLSTGRRVWPLNYMLWCHHKQELQWERGKKLFCGHPGAILRNIEKQMSGNIKKRLHFHLLKSVYLLSSSRSERLHLKKDKHKWVRLTTRDSEEVEMSQELLLLTCFPVILRCWISLSGRGGGAVLAAESSFTGDPVTNATTDQRYKCD